MENRDIYVVFSATPYRMGRWIRRITGEPYNHVSVALDPALTQMYSFARRYYRTPFYGGFVRESLSRYHVKGQPSQIRICRLPVTPEGYDTLARRLEAMYAQKDRYLYNHLGAVWAAFHRNLPAKDAYICAEFVAEVLQSCTAIGIQPGRYYSVGDLQQLLASYEIYTGPIPEAQTQDEAYYAARPVPYPLCTTLRDMAALLPRLGK